MKNLNKIKLAGELFAKGAAIQLTEQGTIQLAAVVGLHQGLKYNGSVVRGLKGSAAIFGVACTYNGIRNVANNMHVIKSLD